MTRLFVAVYGLAVFLAAAAEAPRGFYRFPTLHGDSVIFTAEGDLWRVPVSGGPAQRLTSHPGMEQFAAFSPDGATVAFAAQYEGPSEVYTMPSAGGLPTRHTFDGSEPRICGWTRDGQILYRTARYSTLPNQQLVRLDPRTGQRELVPLAQAAEGVYDPEGRNLYFTRFPKQSSSTKRYRGGWIENLWRFSQGASEAVPLATDFDGTSRNPMWWNDRVHFISDRDGVMNLWSMATNGTDLRQTTRHTGFDIQTAALQGGRIVYARAGDLHLHQLFDGSDSVIPITLSSDLDQQRERWVKRPLDYLTHARISPNGDRLALTARGQVFVTTSEPGRLVEVPRPPGVRLRSASFLPDGRQLLALSDASGELEFWKLPANGVGPSTPLTTNGTVFRYPGVPSPDGQRLAWGDKNQELWVLHLGSNSVTRVAGSPVDEITDFSWSPDGRWLAYVQAASNSYPQIHLYQVEDGARATVTSDRVDSYNPVWSPDGQWLYFLTDRRLRSLVGNPWGPRQPEPYFSDTTQIFAVALTPDARWPFQESTELSEPAAESEGKDKDKDNSKKSKDAPAAPDAASSTPAAETASKDTPSKESAPKVTVDLAGIADRLYEVPAPAGNFQQLAVSKKHLFWLSRDTGFDSKQNLRQLEITRKDPKPKTLVEEVTAYELSADGKKLLVRKGDQFHVIASDASAPAKLEDKFRLDDWTFAVIPREEWRQIFVESWRMMRDYFYDQTLHQLDWPAVRDRYLSLVDRVSDRAELNEVLAEMMAELSTLHIYVRFGDERGGPEDIPTASLGALLARAESEGGWRVERIYETDPEYPRDVSPLRRPEVGVRPGDIITAVNGRASLSAPHFDQLLRNQAGRQVLLEVKPAGTNTTRQVVVKPLTSGRDADLRYSDWEYSRRREVEARAGGQIGYVHLRAMGSDNIVEWAREFYPVFNRPGLIIDVRNNRGGNIDSWILGRLLRKAWFYWQPRIGQPTWNMQYAFRGHVVVLCNERTASDGEAFSEGFRRLGLGKVIGTRTWGGEIWLSARRWLVDSGMASAAEIGVYGPEGTWLIEGHGVDPDQVVDNLPHETFGGRDAQLEAAIQHLQTLIATDPRPVPSAPKYPDKRFPK
ncbi:MAG: PD40 domain-containing protein [Verrucomicrobiae bacterium]|nr:PD40 domain-containing protein [Verrucomicrobiae bacterium]